LEGEGREFLYTRETMVEWMGSEYNMEDDAKRWSENS